MWTDSLWVWTNFCVFVVDHLLGFRFASSCSENLHNQNSFQLSNQADSTEPAENRNWRKFGGIKTLPHWKSSKREDIKEQSLDNSICLFRDDQPLRYHVSMLQFVFRHSLVSCFALEVWTGAHTLTHTHSRKHKHNRIIPTCAICYWPSTLRTSFLSLS